LPVVVAAPEPRGGDAPSCIAARSKAPSDHSIGAPLTVDQASPAGEQGSCRLGLEQAQGLHEEARLQPIVRAEEQREFAANLCRAAVEIAEQAQVAFIAQAA